MGILGNVSRQNLGANRFVGGGAVALSLGNNRNGRPGLWLNSVMHSGETTILDGAAMPTGYYPPSAWFKPITAGEMSFQMSGEGDVTWDLIPSYPMAINMTGSGTLTATAALAVAMAIAMTGSGTLAASLSGRLNAAIAMTGSGDLDVALEALANMACDLTGSGDLDATIAALGNMSIDITVSGAGLTIENVGPAVWAAIAADNDIPGSMGEIMNNVGAGADPWATLLPGAYAPGTAGQIVGEMIENIFGELVEDNGLDTLTVLQALRLILASATGPLSGAAGTTVTIRDALDHIDRIIATVDASGNRISVDLDVSD